MSRNWLVVALSIGGAAAIANMIASKLRRRKDKQDNLKTDVSKTDVSMWEDEGGNIPAAPTVSPHPPV
jgi:hypothetical protein